MSYVLRGAIFVETKRKVREFMAVGKKYYRYNYNVGDKDIEIREIDCYESEMLNETDVFINNHGVYKFYMYSDSKDNVDTFLYQISRILSNEMNAASHLYRLASGRFSAFDSFWKEYNNEKERINFYKKLSISP